MLLVRVTSNPPPPKKRSHIRNYCFFSVHFGVYQTFQGVHPLNIFRGCCRPQHPRLPGAWRRVINKKSDINIHFVLNCHEQDGRKVKHKGHDNLMLLKCNITRFYSKTKVKRTLLIRKTLVHERLVEFQIWQRPGKNTGNTLKFTSWIPVSTGSYSSSHSGSNR